MVFAMPSYGPMDYGKMAKKVLDTAGLAMRFYINGFPKAGLHLLANMLTPIADQMPNDWLKAPWVGMYQGQSFTTNPVPFEQTTFGIARTREGYFMKGHCGYSNDINVYLYLLGIIHIFVFRDLRDVAVSQAFHILSADNKRLYHPNKEIYQKLGGFDEILSAVIIGLEEYAGVMERWELYAGWLDQDWVLSMPFEQMRRRPVMASQKILTHTMGRMVKILRMDVKTDKSKVFKISQAMARAGNQRKRSPTYRKGRVGDWKKHFKPQHVEQFKETDKNNWLIKLGYADDEDWSIE